MDSINEVLRSVQIVPKLKLPTHRKWTKQEKCESQSIDIWFICGTNLLTGLAPLRKSFFLDLKRFLAIRNKCVLIGVGWSSYENFPVYSKYFYRWMLNKNFQHSVRDNYTLNKAKSFGRNLIMTSCPTTWNIENLRKRRDTSLRPNRVVLTLTDYHQDFDRDSLIIKLLKSQYEEVVFWPQGVGDAEYISRLDPTIEILERNIGAFKSKIETGYLHLGTRLHASILALNLSDWSICIAIDNRATEIARDIGIQIVQRQDITKSYIFHPTDNKLQIPYGPIDQFIQQFQDGTWKS